MRPDSRELESERMGDKTLESYPWMHERHRIFPQVFEDRNHRNVLDISAGIGVIAKMIISSKYPCTVSCNEVDETCLTELRKLPVDVTSFDLDTGQPFPLPDAAYDAVICLATIEHLIHIDLFVKELYRILDERGRLYLSVPNYASLYWMIPFLLKGRTFHNPLGDRSRYEFYAHIRYFTYLTLLEFMENFGFKVDTVYLPLPKGSTRFQEIRKRSRTAAFMIQNFFRLLYYNSPRWHQEPVICFAKDSFDGKTRKVIL